MQLLPFRSSVLSYVKDKNKCSLSYFTKFTVFLLLSIQCILQLFFCNHSNNSNLLRWYLMIPSFSILLSSLDSALRFTQR